MGEGEARRKVRRDAEGKGCKEKEFKIGGEQKLEVDDRALEAPSPVARSQSSDASHPQRDLPIAPLLSLLSRAPTRSTRRKGREKRRANRNDSNFSGRANERGRQAAAAARGSKAALFFVSASANLLCKVRCIGARASPLAAPLPSLLLRRARARVTFCHFFGGKREMTQKRSGQRRPKSGCQARPFVRRRASRPARRRTNVPPHPARLPSSIPPSSRLPRADYARSRHGTRVPGEKRGAEGRNEQGRGRIEYPIESQQPRRH